MRFIRTPLDGSFLIELDKRPDDRGFFARVFCTEEFNQAGLKNTFVQANTSWNRLKGTLRGLHCQLPPASEVKVVRCTRGSLFDVIVDLRPRSPTFKGWFGATLTSLEGSALYVPEGFAHGYITLEDDTEALYLVSAPYSPTLERGIRWNDPSLSIKWPLEPVHLSARDRSHPDFNPTSFFNDNKD